MCDYLDIISVFFSLVISKIIMEYANLEWESILFILFEGVLFHGHVSLTDGYYTSDWKHEPITTQAVDVER